MVIDLITESREESERLAERLAKHVEAPALILLDGELAAGKTTFVRGFAKGFGSTDETSSPTYTLANIYSSPRGQINHLDLYRLEDANDLDIIGFEDYISAPAVTLIEWPEIAELEDQAQLIIKIEVLDENRRRFKLKGDQSILEALAGGDYEE